MNKTKRSQLLQAQDRHCACCHSPIVDSGVYDKRKNAVLCRPCAILVFSVRNGQERGIGFVELTTYETMDEIIIKSALRQKVEAGQVLSGATGLPYASWAEAVANNPEWERF